MGVTIHRYESVSGWINTDAATSICEPLNRFKMTQNLLMHRFNRCETVEGSFNLISDRQLISSRFHTDPETGT